MALPRPKRFGEIALVVISVAALAFVIERARERPAESTRCGAHLVALGPRCCAEGQKLDGDRCEGRASSCPSPLELVEGACVAPDRRVVLPEGLLRIGPGDWEAEKVKPHEAKIASFELDAFEATEKSFGECIQAGACAQIAVTGERGRAMSDVTRSDAAAYCAYRGGRLPTHDELAFAAAGTASRRYPWGDTGAVCRRVAWGLVSGPCGEGARGPEWSGSHPDGASPEGVFDLAGNVAEWTSDATIFGGSWADSSVSALRTWQRKSEDPSARSKSVGVRCAYEKTARDSGAD